MVEALQKFSKLFKKIATAKSELAKTREQRNNLQNHPNARQAVPLPRDCQETTYPRKPTSKGANKIAEADC
jgi:hypothetical protein